ncbi:TPA: ParM/StbA family protein [Clostridioides difficile]|nr:ParM/StbA family protein [Clostridioides difficile]
MTESRAVAPNVRRGIDLGNGYVKFDGRKFATKSRVGRLLKGVGVSRTDLHSVIYNEVEYIVGEGEMLTGDAKYFDPRYRLILLTAVAESGKRFKNIKARVCVGVPMLDRDRLEPVIKQEILSWGEQSIIVNGREHNIEIVEVEVFIEGALPILTEDTREILTIDIGAGTINVAQWSNMSPVDYDTLPSSFINMYSDMAKYINENFGGGFTSADVEKLVCAKKTKTPIKQKMTDISDIYLIMDEFVSGAVSQIKETFKTDQIESVQILGGGAEATFSRWQKYFPEAELVANSQTINSEIFDIVANM